MQIEGVQSEMKMFQISEADLKELEWRIPALIELASSPKTRVAARVIKKILSDVRWNYGPHENVEIVEASE